MTLPHSRITWGVILAASDSEGINAGRGALSLCAAGLNWANRPWTKTGQS